MAERTYLHVGTPKSGTSYLQTVLWHNHEALSANGVLVPGRMIAHYAAAKAITVRHGMGGTDAAINDAAWPRLARQVNRWAGTAVIAHPLFAGASAERARQALALLDGEVHLIITARALHHQPAASWQEQVKSGRTTALGTFVDRLRDERARGRRFWRVNDIAAVAARWHGSGHPDHVHVVPVQPLTAESSASAPRQLWSRYAGVLGIDPDGYDSCVDAVSSNLGPAEIELLRSVHARRDPRFTDAQRHLWTRQLLANDLLARRPAVPLRLPDGAGPWLSERATHINARIVRAGFDVAGDLSELAWSDPSADARLVSGVTADEQHDVTAWTILRLQEELVHREPVSSPPSVGPADGIDGVLELLEHIRAADTGARPRAASPLDGSRVARLKRALPVRRRR